MPDDLSELLDRAVTFLKVFISAHLARLFLTEKSDLYFSILIEIIYILKSPTSCHAVSATVPLEERFDLYGSSVHLSPGPAIPVSFFIGKQYQEYHCTFPSSCGYKRKIFLSVEPMRMVKKCLLTNHLHYNEFRDICRFMFYPG